MTRQLDEPVEAHAADCSLWMSDDPLDACDCGADTQAHDQRNPVLPQPTPAQRIDRIHAVPLACDSDTDEAAAS